MPKKKNVHRLQMLRKICGLKQHEMAKLLGCAYRTIVAIENGQRPITADMKRRLMVQTGVHPVTLDILAPKSIDGRMYSREFFDRWRAGNKTRQPGEGLALSAFDSELIEKASLQLRWLNLAAANKNKLLLALLLFQEWLKTTVYDLKLWDFEAIANREKKHQYDAEPIFKSSVALIGRTIVQPAQDRQRSPARRAKH